MLAELNGDAQPINLRCQACYGNIVTYCWLVIIVANMNYAYLLISFCETKFTEKSFA